MDDDDDDDDDDAMPPPLSDSPWPWEIPELRFEIEATLGRDRDKIAALVAPPYSPVYAWGWLLWNPVPAASKFLRLDGDNAIMTRVARFLLNTNTAYVCCAYGCGNNWNEYGFCRTCARFSCWWDFGGGQYEQREFPEVPGEDEECDDDYEYVRHLKLPRELLKGGKGMKRFNKKQRRKAKLAMRRLAGVASS